MTRTVALLLSFLLGATVAAQADDFGPPSSIQAVRYDAVRLLAHTVESHQATVSEVQVSDVVVVGDWALASWKSRNAIGVMALKKQRGQWWDVADFAPSQKDEYWTMIDGIPPFRPATHSVYRYGMAPIHLASYGLPSPLVAESAHIPVVERDAEQLARYHRDNKTDFEPFIDNDFVSVPLNLSRTLSFSRSTTAGYSLRLDLRQNNATEKTTVKRVYARMPTDGESTQTLHGDAFYFFTIELSGPKPVVFQPGTTVDVWFPHVLDTYRHYGLTAAMSNSSFGPVRATLANNALHFVLPGFTVAPNDPVMFEIDGDV